jgi:hypothetical protein
LTARRLGEEQAGFLIERSCTYQIAALRIITDNSLEWNPPVDFEKAFDRVDSSTSWKLLYYHGIPGKFINLMRAAYNLIP